MIPAPGEATAGYWSGTSYEQEVRERYDDAIALFYQDVPPQLAAEAQKRARRQSEARLGCHPDEIDGGHTPALSRPHELADRFEARETGMQ
jgi:hypothetical protein